MTYLEITLSLGLVWVLVLWLRTDAERRQFRANLGIARAIGLQNVENRVFAENERDEALQSLNVAISERDELLLRLLHQESALEVEPMSETDADEILESRNRALEVFKDMDLDLSDPRWNDRDKRHETGAEL